LSLAASPRAAVPAAETETRFPLAPTALVAWAAIAAASLYSGWRVFDAMSTDDLMRLIEVRDFLAGQGWFDVTQYRLDPPMGVAMHWSRLVDLPIAALITALSPVLGRTGAEAAAAATWPLLLMLPTLALAGALARRLSNATAMLIAIVLCAVSAPVLVHFRPGALDHHGYQLMLLLMTIYGVSARGEARLLPALGGLAAAASIAIGIEMMPALAAIVAACGLRWTIEGGRAANLTASFGIAFGVGTAALFAATVPPSAWHEVACDTISLPFVAGAELSGGMLALLAQTGARFNGVFTRLVVGAIAGGIVLATAAVSFPACLQDPFAGMDPRMAEVWLSHVAEAQDFLALAGRSPGEAIVIYAPIVAALIVGLAAALRAPAAERSIWMAPLFSLLTLAVIAGWEVRGAAGANLLAQPVLAAALVRILRIRGSLPDAKTALAFVAVSSPFLAGAGAGVDFALRRIDPARPVFYETGPLACRKFDDVAAFARLTPGRVISYIDIGPAILAGSRHSVFAAPYHRNLQGNGVALDILLGDDATARRTLAEHRIDYVAICPGSPERINFGRAAPAGLSERLARGEVPPYLQPISTDPAAPLRIFRVR
jgi:hypothetical protein